MKRFLSILLILAALAGLLSVAAMAGDEASAEPAGAVTDPAGAEEAPVSEPAAAAEETPVTDAGDYAAPPVLTGIWPGSETYSSDDDIEVIASTSYASEDIIRLEAEFRSSTTGDTLTFYLSSTGYDFDLDEYTPYADGNLHGTCLLMDPTDDTFVLDSVTIYYGDDTTDSVEYTRDTLPASVAGVSFSVTSGDESDDSDDSDDPDDPDDPFDSIEGNPTLEHLFFNSSVVRPGESITVRASASDSLPTATVTNIQVEFVSERFGTTLTCTLTPDSNSFGPLAILTGTISVPGDAKDDTYSIEYVTVFDSRGDSTEYAADSFDNETTDGLPDINTATALPDDIASLSFSICHKTMPASDTVVSPALIYFAPTAVICGHSFTAAALATDDCFDVYKADFHLVSENGSYFNILMRSAEDLGIKVLSELEGDVLLCFTVDTAGLPAGVYSLESVTLYDAGGHQTTYSADSETSPLPDCAASAAVTLVDISGSGWVKSNGSWYYIDDNGELLSDTTEMIDGQTYAFRADGTMITGWGQTSDGCWYYCKTSGVVQKTGWTKMGGVWYYLDKETGVMAADEWVDGYYLTSSGAMATGWAQDEEGGWMLFSSAGKQLFNWQKSGGVWYYLDPESGIMVTDAWIGGYYVTPSGAMATGWCQIEGDWYYFDSNGNKKTGWVKSGVWYYLDPETGIMVTDDWVDGYYLTDSGAMATGWYQIDGDWYCFDSNGNKKTGWVKSGSSWYFLYTDTGVMVKDTVIEVGGVLYSFGPDGVWTGYAN